MRRLLFCGLALAAGTVGGPAAGIHPMGEIITLEQAYDMTLASDQSIRIAYWQVRQANLLPWSALARLGPQIVGGATYNRSQTRGPGNIIVGQTVASPGKTESVTVVTNDAASNVNIAYTQPLIDFSVFPAYKFGRLSVLAARLQHRFIIRQTLFGVASAYYQVLSQQGVVEVDRKTVNLAKEQLDVAQKRLDVGEVTRTDVLNAKVTYESAERTLVQDKNTLLADRDTLGNILNLGGDNGFELAAPPDYPAAIPPFETLLATAYGNREDLKVGNLVIDEDVQKKGEVWAEYAPSVTGAASDSYNNQRGFYGPHSTEWDATVNVSMPFFTGGQREIDLQTAREQVEEDKLSRDKISKTVESDVRQAWLTAHSLADTMPALRLQVAAASQSYQDEVNQYKAGTAASVDVLTALTTLNSSENTLAMQVNQLQIALRNLEEVSSVFQEQRVRQAKVK